MSLINCERELDLSWSRYCVISEISIILRISPNPNANPTVQEKATTQTNGATFQHFIAKSYVPVVTLSINDNINFLENIKQGFKRTISWNTYRCEIRTQTKNNNLDYLIDLTIRSINRLFVLSFKNGNDDPTRNSFDKYYMSLVEIKDFNTLIFDHSVNKKRMKNLLKCQEIMIIQQKIY